MSTQTYDIEKVKKYFFFFCFPEYKSYSLKFKTKHAMRDSLIGNCIGIFLSTIGLFFVIKFSLIDRLVLEVMLIFGIIMIFSFIISIINFRKTWRFRQIEKYFSLKSSLTPFLEKFEQSTKKDIFTEGVDAIEVDEIRQSMEHISALISLLSGPLIQFRRIGTSLPDEAKLVLEKFISLEMEWITETVKDFRISLSLWLGVHASELSAYEKEKLQSGNESLYSLSQSRLEAHREDIEKVMINL